MKKEDIMKDEKRISRRSFLKTTGAAVVATAAGSSLIGRTAWGAGPARYLSIATCGTAGVSFPLGAGFARVWNKVPGVNATAEASGCSVVNLRLMEQGLADAGLCQNDAVYFAVNGLKFFEKGNKATKPRGVVMMYDEFFHIATTKQSGIKKIEDLRGKRVAVGYPGGIVTENVIIVLEAYGMTLDDMKAQRISLADAFDQIKDGNIDAVFETSGAPGAGFLDLAHTRDMVLLPVDKEHAEKIIKKFPFFSPAVFKAGTYRGQDQDIPTLAERPMLIVSKDLPTDLVYNLTKAIFENLDILAESHIKGKDVKLETALRGMPIALHPGAEKYYREVGKIK